MTYQSYKISFINMSVPDSVVPSGNSGGIFYIL